MAFGRTTVTAARGNERDLTFVTSSSALWIPYELRPGVKLYGTLGARLTHTYVAGRLPYWSGDTPLAAPQPDAQNWKELEKDSLQPGLLVGFGGTIRMSDWSPVWTYAELNGTIDRLDGGGTGWRIVSNIGVALWK